ncbi:MAG: hypothetical protein AB1554_06370 [Chloroflexota bacterium]
MKGTSGRFFLPSLILGVLLFPLLAGLVAGGPAGGEERTAVIGLNFQRGTQSGEPDRLIGQAPPGMELAVYLNDELLDVTDSDATGGFSLDMPVLPQRRNDIAVLPTELDSSTLALLYDPRGFDALHIPPAKTIPAAPFLAAAIRQPDGLQLYGSVVPFTQVEIFAESCLASKPNVTVEPDDEGSFIALLPLNAEARAPDEYCIRVTPEDGLSEAETYQVAAPGPGPARGESVWTRGVQLKFTPTEVSLTFSVEMPDGYLVYQNLASGRMSELQFIEYVFGEVSLNAYLDPRKLAWRQEKEPGSHRVRVLVESQPLTYLIPDDTATTFQLNASRLDDNVPPYSDGDTITAALEGVHVLESTPPATSSTASEATWRGTLSEKPTLTLWASRSPLPPADPIARARLLDTLSSIVTDLKINPPALLDKTLEGQIVGILPARVPAAVEAQVYDYFSSLDRGGDFTVQSAEPRTFQSFLRDLPARVPTWLADLLFGAIWLIPAALALVTLQADDSASAKDVRDNLTRLAAGVVVLTLLGMSWFPVFARLGLDREAYINWLLASHLVFLILFLPLPRLDKLYGNYGVLFGVAIVFALLAAFAGNWLQVVLPDGWLSALLTGLPLLGCAFLFWRAAGNTRPPSWGVSIFALAVIFGLSLPIQALPLTTQLGGSLGVTTLGVNLIRPLISISLLLGIVMALRLKFDRTLGGRMSPLERGLGRVLLVGFAVGLSPAWGFVPVSVIGALLLFEWLLPVKLLQPEKTVAEFAKVHHEAGVRQMLGLNRQNRLWRSFESSAPKNIRENKLSEEEYHRKRQEHDEQKRVMEQPEYLRTDKLALRDLAFNFGAGPRHRDNLRHALAWGLILAAPLVIFQGWPLVMSETETAGPLPFLSVGVRLLALTAQYLAAAALLGYFFPYLRGRNGLEKGGWLAGTIILSFLPYHLIFDTTALEWMVAGIWAGSVLAFNLIISLLAFDIRTLLHFKLGWFRLPDLYDFGELAAYLTGSGAPLIATIYTTFTSKLDEWVPALLNVVFPSFTFTSTHSELLQVLLDLANRIASGLFN